MQIETGQDPMGKDPDRPKGNGQTAKEANRNKIMRKLTTTYAKAQILLTMEFHIQAKANLSTRKYAILQLIKKHIA